jgi:transcriptional regulator with XRE-family HTH domain
MTTSHDFGPHLKGMRERRGITLEAIADTTKIALPLLESLERSNVSHWPKGIFRRAFFRDYAAAIGAPVEDMLAEFLRLFPEDGHAAVDAHSSAALRMTLATVRSPMRLRVTRIVAGLAEAGVVVLLGLAAAWLLAVERPTAVAVVGLLYYPMMTGWLGRSAVLMWLHDPIAINRGWRTAPARQADVGAAVQAVSQRQSRGAGAQRDRRTGVDRRRAPRMVHEPETAPIAGVFGLRKGSAA